MNNKTEKCNFYVSNLICFTLVNILWQTGSTLVHPETSLIYLLEEIKASNFAVASVVPTFLFFSSVPCVFWGSVIHVNRNMRKVLYLSCLWIIVPYLLIYLIMGYMDGSTGVFIRLLFVLLIVSNVGLSLEAVAYQNYVSYVVPEKKRGTLWGIVFSFGYVLSLLAYPVMNYMNSHLSTYMYYRTGFLIFFIFALAATHFFLLVKEPEEQIILSEEKTDWKRYFSSCKEILVKDKNFTRYLLIQYLGNFSICITSFSLVYIIGLFKTTNDETIRFTIIYCMVFGIGSFVAGRLGDKKGFYSVMMISFVIVIIFTTLLIINKSEMMSYILYAFIIFGLGMKEVANINIPIDSTRNPNKAQHIGIAKTVTAPSLLISLLLGQLVDKGSLSVENVLWISVGGLIMGFILNCIFVKEPRTVGSNNR